MFIYTILIFVKNNTVCVCRKKWRNMHQTVHNSFSKDYGGLLLFMYLGNV